MRSEEAAAAAAAPLSPSPAAAPGLLLPGTSPPPPPPSRGLPGQRGRLEPAAAMEVPQLDLLESPEGCPSPLELKSAPSKKMWVKLRAL
uniref:calcium/calmodulin-dependent 3',5'-cyclic nucleotide phosphodiesterase 1B isoform X2 n=1 Tax=Podarcis muralis TaxID=64176 RepID=UPI0010A06671|nr:calcium/calmodulin-dependent 3',5'-cyclic nucleotide phosphodiesterase 1B isoform X2 [Podarcis muralis]